MRLMCAQVAAAVKSPLHGRLFRKAVLSLAATTMPLDLSVVDSAKRSLFLIATTTALKEMTHTQQRAHQAAHLNTRHRVHAHATQTPRRRTTTLPLTNGLSVAHLVESCLVVAVLFSCPFLVFSLPFFCSSLCLFSALLFAFFLLFHCPCLV